MPPFRPPSKRPVAPQSKPTKGFVTRADLGALSKLPAEITGQAALEKKLDLLGLTNLDQRKKVTCALLGHSDIVHVCMGQVTCGRCGEILGDMLAGAYDASGKVIVDHDCETCRANAKALTWRDTYLAPEPFPKAS